MKTTSMTHHPHTATLMSFASGALPEALAAVVACHLERCPRCRHDVRTMEHIGDGVLAAGETAALERPAPLHALLRQEAGDGRTGPSIGQGTVLERLVPSMATVQWQSLGGGVAHAPIPTASGSLRLIRVEPGRTLPDHGHTGAELTMVLEGAFSDAGGIYRPGDVADLDEEAEHVPRAEDEGVCICLLATESRLRFKRLLHRLILPRRGL